MDSLRELQAKREQLRLLRERKKQFVAAQSWQISDKTESKINDDKNNNDDDGESVYVDVSTQTDVEEASDGRVCRDRLANAQNTKDRKEHIVTYDKGVQTVPLVTGKEEGEEIDVKEDEEEQQELSTDDMTGKSKQKTDVLSTKESIKLLDPLNINEDEEGTNDLFHSTQKSFALEWYSRGGISQDSRQSFTASMDRGIRYLHTWNKLQSQWAEDPSKYQNLICVSIDYDPQGQFTLLTFQQHNDNKNDGVTQITQLYDQVPRSYVFVIDANKDTIIDEIEFTGQLITHGRILRKFETHNIISMLLISKRGKTILYEIKKSVNTNKWERHLISRNYHIGCPNLFGIWENKFRLITGDMNGVINILNSLDLSVYKDATSDINKEVIKVRLIPPMRNELNTEDDQGEHRHFVDHYLSKLTIFNDVVITCMVGSPFDENCLFIGTDDGGIYKVMLVDIKDSALKLKVNNNDFLPSVEDNGEQRMVIMFHSSQVTNLSFGGDNGLLLSSSLDWTIILWNIRDNVRLDSIDLRTPILSVQWIEMNTNDDTRLLCSAITWNKIYIIEWFVQEKEQHMKKTQGCKILSSLDVGSGTVPFERFTSYKVVVNHHNNSGTVMVIAGGTNNAIAYYEIKI